MIRVGDFGLAVQLSASGRRVCGTTMYMAPEVYEGSAVLKSDVWSLGMSAIEMADGKHPFAGWNKGKVKRAVMSGDPPSLPSSGWSSDLMDFVKRCLVKDAEKSVGR